MSLSLQRQILLQIPSSNDAYVAMDAMIISLLNTHVDMPDVSLPINVRENILADRRMMF